MKLGSLERVQPNRILFLDENGHHGHENYFLNGMILHTTYVTGPRKNVLHRISGLLRGHGSANFLQKFDDNLYVHISDVMDELKRQFPNDIDRPWSIRSWIGIIANDEKSRYSTLAVVGLQHAESIGYSHCPVKIRAAQDHQASLVEGRNPTTLARIVYCNPYKWPYFKKWGIFYGFCWGVKYSLSLCDQNHDYGHHVSESLGQT